ncbi:hypothetical protein F5Y03DRAFT_382154 [Xylaria venustula]|nr:hypothetical protein F5Y03DRAFT_382154 [Xylaria venustula]
MASNQQRQTFTVPMGNRLSYGVELEFLVAYVYTSDADPDASNSSNLAPILRVDSGDKDSLSIKKHIQTTLRDHGIQVRDDAADLKDGVPLHLDGLDCWGVDIDHSVHAGQAEYALDEGKYQWLGMELQSPACWDVSTSYDEIDFVVNLLKSRYRLRLNPSCGLHVHVGNGPRYFDANTLKRAGAFLWAADPMLSRLHAPWRRVGQYATSIRYGSYLARSDGMQPADAQALVDADAAKTNSRGRGILDPIPVAPWSDTSRDEAELGGRANWELHARKRLQNGPFITLDEIPPSPHGSDTSNDSSRSELHSSSSSSSSSSAPPPDDHGNEGGAYDRRFQELLRRPEFRIRCNQQFGHPYPSRLRSEEQYVLLLVEFCDQLYSHANVRDLTDSEYAALTETCAPYTDIAWSVWLWDNRTNLFSLDNAAIGPKLHAPRPRLYRDDRPSLAYRRLSTLADQLDRGEIALLFPNLDTDDIESVGEDDLEKGMWDVVDSLMDQSEFPLDLVDSLVRDQKRAKEIVSQNRERVQERLDAYVDGTPSPEFGVTDIDVRERTPGSADFIGASPAPRAGTAASSEPASTDPYLSPFTDSSGGFNPPAWQNWMDAFPAGIPSPAVSPGNSGSNSPPGLRGGGGSDFKGFNRNGRDLGHGPDMWDDISLSRNSNHDSDSNSRDSRDGFTPAVSSGSGDNSASPTDDRPAHDEISGTHNSSTSSPFRNSVSSLSGQKKSGGQGNDKLQPHDIRLFSSSYISTRISWLPHPARRRGLPDPIEAHERYSQVCPGPDCRGHAVTDIRTGLAIILAVDSAAALASLLISPPRDTTHTMESLRHNRLNYNFTAYAPTTLASGFRDAAKRTIEFREAGGSLDTEWIATWSRICVGIMRFCRDAPVDKYIDVLERIVRQEERTRDGRDVRYDVCDLLEDIGLFAESAVVRRREVQLGPPR